MRRALVATILCLAWWYWSLLQTSALVHLVGRGMEDSLSQVFLGCLAAVVWVVGAIPAMTGFLLAVCLSPPVAHSALGRPPSCIAPRESAWRHPILIERVVLTEAQARARGLDSPVIVERLHFHSEGDAQP